MHSEARPLIGTPVVSKNTERSSYSKVILGVIAASLFAVGGYLSYELLGSKHQHKGKLSPEHIALVTEENGYSEDAQNDLIKSMPNLDEEMTFKMFSGYLEATNNREIFYWFMESQSDTADEDPLVIWTNGGPGCSGLVGLLTEHGAYWVYDDLSLKSNPYSWNKMANMLYVEQPYGVGFSVVDNDDTYVTGDDNAATDMDALVRSFLKKYPKFQSNDFYVASESYGGHYVPFTTKKILENNEKGYTPTVNLKGMLVGNPLNSYYHNDEGFISALYGHGLIKKSIYTEWQTKCEGNEEAVLYSDTCYALYVQAYLAAYDADPYALDFPTCTYDNDDLAKKGTNRVINTERKQFHLQARERVRRVMKNEALLKTHFKDDKEMIEQFKFDAESAIGSDTVAYVACNTYDLVEYLNLDEVQEALHVKTESMTSDWDYCNMDVNSDWPDSDWLNDMSDTYHTLAYNYDIKMLMYSGDDDSVCALQGTQTFLEELDFVIDKNYNWDEWTFNGQLSGYYTRYLNKEDGTSALHFQTVRSAGHMVPTTQPERAYELFSRFFNYYDKTMENK